MANSEQKGNELQVENPSRRDFLRNSAYAAAGAVAKSMAAGSGEAKAASAPKKAAAWAGSGLKLISPIFETSPTYLATYPASDRAKKIVKDAIVIDTLFSAVYPLQRKNDEQFHPVMDECLATGMDVLGFCCSADVASSDPKAVIDAVKFPMKKIFERPDKYAIVRSVRDIREAKKKGKLGFYFIHQGSNLYGGDVDNVALFR